VAFYYQLDKTSGLWSEVPDKRQQLIDTKWLLHEKHPDGISYISPDGVYMKEVSTAYFTCVYCGSDIEDGEETVIESVDIVCQDCLNKHQIKEG
jgi:DNA-directed RNA polymerase subunit RPC12/RpoP